MNPKNADKSLNTTNAKFCVISISRYRERKKKLFKSQ